MMAINSLEVVDKIGGKKLHLLMNKEITLRRYTTDFNQKYDFRRKKNSISLSNYHIKKFHSNQKSSKLSKNLHQATIIKKSHKYSLKLPNINIKLKKFSTFDSQYPSKTQKVDNKNGRRVFQSVIHAHNFKSISEQILALENKSDNKTDNKKNLISMKYLQIGSMKLPKRIVQSKSKFQVRNTQILKIQKLVSKDKQKYKLEKQINNIELKICEKTECVKISEQKDENISTAHSIKKTRKILSINHPVVRKNTNTHQDFCLFLCLLNKMERPVTPIATYKAYIGMGNNSILIKNSLKSRFWWNVVDDSMDVNLYWTQNLDSKFIKTLQCYNCELKQSHQTQQDIDKNSEKIDFILVKQLKVKRNQKNDLMKQYIGQGLNKFLSKEEKNNQKNNFQVQIIKDSSFRKIENPNKNKIHNHIEFVHHLSNKKTLYYNLKKYYQGIGKETFAHIPLTFHVQKYGDQQWENFKLNYNTLLKQKQKQKNLWIVKPGQNSNQGCGIQVFDSIDDISEMIKQKNSRSNKQERSFIIQKYLIPFLYCKRKFDIRCYILFTSFNGIYKAYWYQEGYIRTSSKQFTLNNLKNKFIHLTNDAVQKKSEDYGKYQYGNKISYSDFQRYLDNSFPGTGYQFYESVYPAMINLATDAIKSTYMVLDANKREFTFQIFGLDFMIDENFQTRLIEVNTNPCLQLSAPLLARIIPNMIQNALKIAVDPIFPPPLKFSKTKILPAQAFQSNKFTLIFNSLENEQKFLKDSK